jgi:hypothetical protein
MKQCPTCSRTYADESLSYCLADGSLLSAPYDPEATQRFPPSRITNAPTEVLPSYPRNSEIARPNRNPLTTYFIIGVLALVAGGGIVAVLTSGTKDTSSPPTSTSNSSNVSNISSTSPVDTPKRNSEPEAKPSPTKSESTPSTTERVPPPPSGDWFVILGSFPRNDYEKASQRLQSVQGLGYEASIIDTGNYPGLKGNLWAVVMGPYSKSYAKSLATQMKSVRSDAYAKSGW